MVGEEYLGESLLVYREVINVLERNRVYLNLNPKCEPQLGKRGLYRKVGAPGEKKVDEMALLWVLNMSDGSQSLLDIAERSGMSFHEIYHAAIALQDCELLKEA